MSLQTGWINKLEYTDTSKIKMDNESVKSVEKITFTVKY
jgi:hypothetical protein